MFFFLPVVAALADEPHRFRHLRARRSSAICASSASATTCSCCRRRSFWQALGNTLLLRRRRRAACRSARRSAPRCCCTRGWRDSRPFFRTALFAPVVTTLVAVAVIWRYLFNTRYGLAQLCAGRARHRPDRLARRSALGDAGDHRLRRVEEFRLQHDHPARRAAEHSEELYEAARIDGASAVATVPLRHAADARAGRHCWSSILTIAGYFQLFAEPYVMTQGGPLQSTVSVLYFMYEEGFKWWNLGSASAVAFRPVPVDLRRHRAAAALGATMEPRVKRQLAGAAGQRPAARPPRRSRCSRCCGWSRYR